MRLAAAWLVLLLALAACELPRPEGAFIELEASVPDASSTSAGIERSDAAVAVAPPIPGGLGGQQAGMQGGTVGATGGTAGGGTPGGNPGGQDAGIALSPQEQALKKLEGRYLMRMDMYSTATLSASIVTINTSNLISHLYVTQLYVENGQLKSYEQLCHQTFLHVCSKNCDLTTKMSPVMTDWFVMAKPRLTRNYVLSNGMLEGRANTLALGFDPTTNPALPTVEDNRVWDPVTGGKREGLLLALNLRAIKNVSCDVYTTQIFVSKLNATKLAGTPESPALNATLKFQLNTDGSDGATIGANNADCQSAAGPDPVAGEQFVRFAPVAANEFVGQEGAEFWDCPTADNWDKRLPATAP